MIPRYDEPTISQIWDAYNKFQTYLDVELAILGALEAKPDSKIPAGTTEKIRKNAEIRPQRIDEIEQQVHHDVIAFCTSITEQFSAEEGRFFHYGVTSSDIIDTATNLQIKKSIEACLPMLETVCDSLWIKANETKNLMTLGRSHGMYAEPMSFGQKFLSFYVEFKRRLKDLRDFYENELTGQFSGAVGNYTILSPEVEKEALESLDLKVEPVSTQVIPRDRLAKLVSINALIACAIERLAVEIRHLHHSDIGELAEGFKKGQKGSSTMPHKKNPISGENLTGMARVLKSHVQLAMENTVLWHERDISHSSAERLFLPDHFGLLFYSLKRLKSTIENLQIFNEKIENKVLMQSSYLSSFYLHHLLEHTTKSREDLYQIVQQAAFDSVEAGPEAFSENIKKNCEAAGIEITDLPIMDQEACRSTFLKHVDHVFNRSKGP